jgi:hypothetical protein
MEKKYSLKSLVFSKFPEVFERLCKVIKYDKIKLLRISAEVKTDSSEYLKELNKNNLPLTIRFYKEGSVADIEFERYWKILSVSVEGFEKLKTDEIHQIIQESLCLTDPTEEDWRSQASAPDIISLLWKLYDRTETILEQFETSEGKPRKRLKCFVSFRFDDHSKALGFELREFLELIGVEFVSGLGYEPRAISEKVLDRLTGELDIFIVIHSSTGDSAWLNQEIGIAKGRKLPILILREETSETDLGMLEGAEYLLFPDNNISKAFVGILQALNFIKKESGRP